MKVLKGPMGRQRAKLCRSDEKKITSVDSAEKMAVSQAAAKERERKEGEEKGGKKRGVKRRGEGREGERERKWRGLEEREKEG